LAKQLVREAQKAGADCVKFQTFRADEIVVSDAPKANYQLKSTDRLETQLKMLKELELSKESFQELVAYCKRCGIEFLSTPYSYRDVDLLEELGVNAFKVASGQLTETPFLEYVAKKGKPLIVSTGMSTWSEVKEAVGAIQNVGMEDLILLQCTTNYPSHMKDAHLRVISSFIQAFSFPIGYSDHTTGETAILGSIALGAKVIEKHFTLDKKMKGPDHSSSMEPMELKNLIEKIRDLEVAMGTNTKTLTDVERVNAQGMKRSLASIGRIPSGAKFESSMLTFKRPATGIPPKRLESIIGQYAQEDIPPDTVIKEEMVAAQCPEPQKTH